MWSRSHTGFRRLGTQMLTFALACVTLFCGAIRARAFLPAWLQRTVSGTAIEAALFRAMQLPHASVLFPRPSAESVLELDRLVAAAPSDAALLNLRAHQEESALQFAAAERDLKSAVALAPDHLAASFQLADFYNRRLAVHLEFDTLMSVATSPAGRSDGFVAPGQQLSWEAFERAFSLARDQSFESTAIEALWQSWMARYPQQSTVYARAVTWELNQNRIAQARAVLQRYKQAFPDDTIFPVKVSALIALKSGGPDAQVRALAVYDDAFQPLWPQSLVTSYFDLLAATHNTQAFVSRAKATLLNNPDDLNAAARLFLYYIHESRADAALEVLERYRRGKEQRDPSGHNWKPDELSTLAQLSISAQQYPQAARYQFALYHVSGSLPDGRTAQVAALEGMIATLLAAPDQPIALGAGNLSMYRDIGTLDQGPGFWNGVLSLWLNTQNIPDAFTQEEIKAQPYFHRAKAAALLTLLDRQAPSSPHRAALRAQLVNVYAEYGDEGAVLQEGASFLHSFPNAPERVPVELAMADADARQKNTSAEFAVYDKLLSELAQQTSNMPLSSAALATQSTPAGSSDDRLAQRKSSDEETSPEGYDYNPGDDSDAGGSNSSPEPTAVAAFELDTGAPSPAPNPAATAYAQVLDRYVGRLTATGDLPGALTVLRRELDRNPNDPKLYERLADFLGENNLSAQQEELYRTAIAKFSDKSWYDKLARLYLREKRHEAFATVTRQVTDIFSGTELDAYFGQVSEGGPQLFLQLNLYAHKRFPHDLLFTQNLLRAYKSVPTKDASAWEQLLRENWWQSGELTNEYFAWLSETGKLHSELERLHNPPPTTADVSTNPAVAEELAQAYLWESQFEQSAPIFDHLADVYPSDERLCTTAVDLNRSLAWLDPAGPSAHVRRAVVIEQRLLSADADDEDRLAEVGDILADHANGTPASYAAAARIWRQIPNLAPGVPDTYLQSATVFWDYFQFDDALAEIDAARTHFSNPTLFGYEKGAVLEGKRDLPSAIREYTAAAIVGPTTPESLYNGDRQVDLLRVEPDNTSVNIGDDPSTERLLQLARRSSSSAQVDAATSAALQHNSSVRALRLRIAVLDAEHRDSEVHPLLLAAVAQAGTADAVADLAAFAQARGDAAVYEAGLQREAALTADPLEELQLTYDLARAYERRGDVVDAVGVVDAVYKRNPRLLGVIRFTVDFDWRNGRQAQAIAVLVEAAGAAQPPYITELLAEAADKANESGDTAQARSIAVRLLKGGPYDARYLSLAAESYTRAGDILGLQQFYRERLDAIGTVNMTSDERKTRTGLLRRGLIPALTQAKDYAGGVDQYIELIRAYPEDASLIHEAALYAQRYGQQAPLLTFYQKTVRDSPRDARFFVDLAQTQVLFGNSEAALDAYTSAVALRPERADLFTAKASIEEHQRRFEAAIADYKRLYQLSYKDPRWMIATAQAEARQGHASEAVQALETAYLRGSQITPNDYFTVARQLEQWDLLQEARTFAERGASAARGDLLAGSSPAVDDDAAPTYARILTRTRQTAEALQILNGAMAEAALSSSSPGAVVAEVKSGGLAAVTDSQWREHYVHDREERAGERYTQALIAIGDAVATYYSPEETIAYAADLRRAEAADPEVLASRWIPAAHAADLGELEATWQATLAMKKGDTGGNQLNPYIQLQHARLAFAQLGTALEGFVQSHPRSPNRAEALQNAAEAYQAAGEPAAELRLLRSQQPDTLGVSNLLETYLNLLLHRDADGLVVAAGSHNQDFANAAASVALAHAPVSVALAAIRSRGSIEAPVWTSSYSALAGVYLRDLSPATDNAFRLALQSDATIGERLARPSDTAQQLTGDVWFYDAARYGEWRLLSPSTSLNADDVLPADLEHNVSPENFLALAQTEAEGGRMDAALTDVAHALELAPQSLEAYDARAVLLWHSGRRQEAIHTWQVELNVLRKMEQHGALPESFWTGFEQVASRARQVGCFDQLKPNMTDILRFYLARNGSFRSNELLHAAFDAAPDETSGVSWIVSLADAAASPEMILQDLDEAAWLSPIAQQALLLREFELLQREPPRGEAESSSAWRLAQVRWELVRVYLHNHDDQRALALIHSAPAKERGSPKLQEAELVASARTDALPPLLASFEVHPETAPSVTTLQTAAAMLAHENKSANARAILEWSFRQSASAHTLGQSQFLGLAEARLHTADPAGAFEVLHSLVATSEDPYVDEDAAATLLEQNHRPADAISFLRDLASGVPWNLTYRVRLAEAQTQAATAPASAVQGLISVAQSEAAPDALRVRAACDLAELHAPSPPLNSAELTLIASGRISSTSVQQPFFTQAQILLAMRTKDLRTQQKLLRGAIANAPYAFEADQWRLKAFEVEVNARAFPTARGILMVMLNGRNFLYSQNQPFNGTSGSAREDLDLSGSTAENSPALPLTAESESPSQRAALAEKIAEVYVATADPTSARPYLLYAQRLLPNSTERSGVGQQIRALDAAQRLASADAACRPVVRHGLDQPVTVRPQLTAAPASLDFPLSSPEAR